MDSTQITADIARQIQEMQDEITDLRAQLAAREQEDANRPPDVKAMFAEGFAKLNEAVKPLAERANAKLGGPAGEAVARVEQQIAAHPFAAVMIALGAGLIASKLFDSGPHYQVIKVEKEN